VLNYFHSSVAGCGIVPLNRWNALPSGRATLKMNEPLNFGGIIGLLRRDVIPEPGAHDYGEGIPLRVNCSEETCVFLIILCRWLALFTTVARQNY